MAHKWATWLHNPCRPWGVPTAAVRGAESKVAHKWAGRLDISCRLGGPTTSERREESEVAHKWDGWLHNPCSLGGPNHFRAEGKFRGGPQVGLGGNITPAALGGSPLLPSGGQNERWPTSGPRGYRTHAAWEFPIASVLRPESELANKWATWLDNPCRPRGFPPLQCGGHNQRWPTSGANGYRIREAWVVPTTTELRA